MTHKKYDGGAIQGFYLEKALCGGWTIDSSANQRAGMRLLFAAFSTLDEALAWIKENQDDRP
jgi:hypothetical protein